jgi:hypothetical protein
VRDGGRLGVITDTAHVMAAVEGRHGTRIAASATRQPGAHR